eukprot:gnl/Trimastix_PCT/745.p1 GENE.gnl/Trimastix_PCT/745~~gnl/Trimastix_PCT/745.p1  ORF type:complete len:285 (-),score=15.42 gnl/Trimastix_PCT/745:163-1017(-)
MFSKFRGVDVHAPYPQPDGSCQVVEGFTIWSAAWSGRTTILEQIVSLDPDSVNALDTAHICPLFYAFVSANTRSIDKLLELGAADCGPISIHDLPRTFTQRFAQYFRKIRRQSPSRGPPGYYGEFSKFIKAASSGNELYVASILDVHSVLEQTALVNYKDQEGHTSLYYACKRGRPSMARLLLAHGCFPDEECWRLANPKIRELMTLQGHVTTRPSGEGEEEYVILEDGSGLRPTPPAPPQPQPDDPVPGPPSDLVSDCFRSASPSPRETPAELPSAPTASSAP